MGTNCANLLSDWIFYSYEACLIDSQKNEKQNIYNPFTLRSDKQMMSLQNIVPIEKRMEAGNVSKKHQYDQRTGKNLT